MAEVDPLIFKILADTKAARAEVQTFQRMTGQGLGRVERDVVKLEAQMKRSSGAIGGHLRGLATTLGSAFTGRELVRLIDNFTRLQNSLRVAGLEGQALESVQSKLLDLSSRYGVGIGELANLYGKSAQAASDLGASEAQLLQITEASAQALKITGTSAVQAQGALLGLTQALASGVVRAEEFNQINEGGLRPLLQVAANTERFGGSVAKLRIAVIEGKVSSREFYQTILAGAAQLEGQASKATLTLAGAFEALTSRLSVYVGQSAQANGATAALAGAMQLLADNLDVIIPALATIAAFMGTRLVVSAIAASRAYAGFTAILAGTATVSATATAGMTALTAALTGPAGIALAITAVGAGLYYMADASDRTEKAIDDLKASNDAASSELDRMIDRLAAAGVKTDDLRAAAERAKGPIDDLADAYARAAFEAQKLNDQTGIGALQRAQKGIENSQGNQAAIQQRLDRNAIALANNPGDSPYSAGGALKAERARLQEELRLERQREAGFRNRGQTEFRAAQNGVSLDDKGSSAPKSPDKPKRPRTRTEKDPLDEIFRNAQDMLQYQLEEKRANEQAATSATEKAKYAREALALERDGRIASVKEAVRKGSLLEEEGKARIKIIENLYGAADEITVQGREAAYQAAITREEQDRIARQQTDAMRDELDALGAESGVTDVRKARVEIERRMLDLQQQIERKLLDEAIARGEVADAVTARAALSRKQEADRTGFERGGKGPLGQYMDDVRKVGLNMDDQFESIAVNGLRSLNDGLTDAIMNSKNLGDVFQNVAKQIIADLIRVAIQQTIVNSLMSAFGGGGGIGGIIGGLFGGGAPIGNSGGGVKNLFKVAGARAGGGPVNAGSLYRVNENASAGNPEYFQPSVNGNIIPLGNVNARAASSPSRQGPIEIRVYAEEGAMFIPRVEAISQGEAVKVTMAAAPALTQRAVHETMRQASRPRMPGAGR